MKLLKVVALTAVLIMVGAIGVKNDRFTSGSSSAKDYMTAAGPPDPGYG